CGPGMRNQRAPRRDYAEIRRSPLGTALDIMSPDGGARDPDLGERCREPGVIAGPFSHLLRKRHYATANDSGCWGGARPARLADGRPALVTDRKRKGVSL